MASEAQRVSIEAFVAFAHRDENIDRDFELINGEIVEVPPSQTNYSEIRDVIAFEVRLFCRDNDLPCHTSGEAGAYHIQDSIIVPDFAYKTTPMIDEYPDPVPPEWAVEVISPSDDKADITRKRQIYMDAGILYWEVYLKMQRVEVYAPGKPMQSYGIDDTLDGGDVLPGFRLPVSTIV